MVKDLSLPPALRKRMMDLGLVPGTPVKIVRKAPLGDPLIVQIRGYQISFRMAEANRIVIEKPFKGRRRIGNGGKSEAYGMDHRISR